MAKIGELTVSSIKIANGALTRFYSSTGSTGASESTTATTTGQNPVIVFVWCETAGTITVTRTRGGKVLGTSGANANSGGVRTFFVDEEPADGDVYTLTGITSGTYREVTAIGRLR